MIRKLSFLVCCGILILGSSSAQAQNKTDNSELLQTEVGVDQIVNNGDSSGGNSKTLVAEDQILKLNQNLRNVIEENKRLIEERQRLADQYQNIRGQYEINNNRVVTLTKQREALEAEKKKLEEQNQQYQNDIAANRADFEKKQKDLETQIDRLKNEIAMEEGWHQEIQSVATSSPKPKVVKNKKEKKQNQDLISPEKINEENDALKREASKVHYNLGNIYFEQGQYIKAKMEYERAVVLSPYDAAAHYNLAFVSWEYLQDAKTALKNYEQYLYLKPNAEDADLVKEKIAAARLDLRTKVNSALDKKMPDKEAEKLGGFGN